MDDQVVPARLKRNSLTDFIEKSTNKIDRRLSKLKLPPILKKSKFVIPIIVVVALFIFLAIDGISTTDSTIPTYTVKRDKFLVSITESGEIRAKNSISISSPRVRGNLKIVFLIPEGTYVQAGDTVVKFDPTEALTNLKDAESKLEISISDKEKLEANHKSTITRLESELKSAELSYELSKLNLEQMKFEAEIKQREEKLNHQRNELSYNKARQDLESQKIVNRSELNKVDIEVQQKRSDLERVQRDLEQLTLTAPTEGLVVYGINWQTGRKFTMGDTPWQGMAIVTLPDLSSMESATFVNEVDVSRVKKGLEVKIKLDAFQDSTFTGTIGSVASLGRTKDNSANIKVFEIAVDIGSQSEILKPGMTTSNKIIVNEIPDVLFIPQEAVFEKDGKKIAYIKSGSDFDETKIEVGEKSENYIVVTKGLKAGEEVALRDPTIKLEEEDGAQDASVGYPKAN